MPKNWRELPLDQRINKIIENFQINQKDIDKILRVSDKKERLLAAARLQYKLFRDVHSYLTAWIAGYGSDAEVRSIFGSTGALRKIFIDSVKVVKGISYSWQDIKRGIKIPEKMNSLLAEETGIHLGDGCLSSYVDSKGYSSYRYSITGDLTDEKMYHVNYIASLLKSLYGIHPIFLKRLNKNTIDTQLNSKAIFGFKTKILGLSAGNKKNISIPKIILENNKFSKMCLVGIFDTDFHITEHLAISGKLHSLTVAKQMHEILLRNNIKHVYRVYSDYARFYIGKEFAEVIVNDWGMHNQKHLTKFKVFEKFGRLIPFTTTLERISLLNGNLSLEELDRLSAKRRMANDSARARTSDLTVSSNSF